jgi:hypothetical protein
MKFTVNGSALRKSILFLLVMTVPALAWGQKKTPSAPAPKPSAPAPKPSAPAHNSAPSSSRPSQGSNGHTGTASPGRPGTSSNTSRPGTTTNGRPGTTTNGRPGTSTNSRPNTTTNGRPNTTTNGRPGTTNTAGRPGTPNNGRPGGTTTNKAAMSRPAPGRQVSLHGGGTANIRPNGQIRSVNRNGMQIQRGMHGGRTVVSTHNGARVVTTGRRGGYVQRAYVTRGGRSYYSRTYYYHGVYRSGVYRGYYYGGRPYYGYYPAYYYQPVYYGWAYNPWPAPAPYAWGWGAAPWYGYYGPYYYQPYPVYPSAAFWLTDFMIAASLQAAYEAQNNAWLRPDAGNGMLLASLAPMAAPAETAKLTPEVKEQIAEEVKLTLAAEQAEAAKGKSSSSGAQPATSNEAPPALDPKFKVFVVSSDMSLVADGDECPLSQGDVISRTTETPDGDGNVNVKVVASTKQDCAVGKEGPVSTDDLQEMYNQFRESLKDGMGELAKKQGTGGLPKAPDTTTVDGDVPAPPPDKNVEKTLQDQQAAADQTESEVKQEAGSSGGGGAQ